MEYLEGNLRFLQEFIASRLPMISGCCPRQLTWCGSIAARLGMSPDELKSFMINEAGLGLNDGPQFGKEGEGFQRINIGCPRQVLHEALVKLHAAIDKYFKK